MIVLDSLLPLRSSLFFHAEPDCPLAPFEGALAIQPSTVAKLPPGTAESFYQAGVRNTVVISGFDDAFADPHAGSVFQEAVTAAQVLPVASTILAFAAQQLGISSTHATAINSTYLESVLGCLAVNGSCTVLESVLDYKEGSITNRLGGVPLDKFCGVLEVLAGRAAEA